MEQVIDQIRRYAEQEGDIDALWLYGSRARGLATLESDYDLAVLFADWIEDPFALRLRPELLAMKWQQQLNAQFELEIVISVLDINLAKLPLAFTVMSDNTLLYYRNSLKVLYKEREILSKWELDYQYHVRHYV